MREFIKKIFSQKKLNTPKPVLQGFKKRFKDAKSAEWSQRGAHWEVLFYSEDHETIAIFDAAGELIEKRINIGINALPTNVNDIASQLGEIMNAIKINGGPTTAYEIILRDTNLIRYVAYVTHEGVLVSNNKL